MLDRTVPRPVAKHPSSINYIELCAGIGGTKLGLSDVGWNCVYANDIDHDAVGVYRSFDTEVSCGDLRTLTSGELPQCDVMVAGFPCQPFSSSGPRLGFKHSSGNVFDHIARLISEMSTPIALFENVRGLLTHDKGNTFLVVLQTLVTLGYSVQWFLVDLKWFGIPQSRPRLIVLAFDSARLPITGESTFNALSDSLEIIYGPFVRFSSVKTLNRADFPKFSEFGFADKKDLIMCRGKVVGASMQVGALGSLVSPNFYAPEKVSSVRYYARGAGTTPLFRNNGVAHCIGNVPGSAPLYSVKLSDLRSKRDRDAFLEGGNWSREQDGHLILRLKPERAVHLFGPSASPLADPLNRSTATLSKKYLMVANLFAPSCARFAAEMASRQVGGWMAQLRN